MFANNLFHSHSSQSSITSLLQPLSPSLSYSAPLLSYIHPVFTSHLISFNLYSPCSLVIYPSPILFSWHLCPALPFQTNAQYWFLNFTSFLIAFCCCCCCFLPEAAFSPNFFSSVVTEPTSISSSILTTPEVAQLGKTSPTWLKGFDDLMNGFCTQIHIEEYHKVSWWSCGDDVWWDNDPAAKLIIRLVFLLLVLLVLKTPGRTARGP